MVTIETKHKMCLYLIKDEIFKIVLCVYVRKKGDDPVL